MNHSENHCAFYDDSDFFLLSSPPQRKRPTEVEDIAELIWQNGQVVTQSQNHRPSSRKTPPPASALSPSPGKFHHRNLYMQDDDMNMLLQCPWGQYTGFEGNEGFCSDFLFDAGSSGDVTTANASLVQNIDALRMHPPLVSFTEPPPTSCHDFPGPRMPLDRRPIVRESTVVDSCATSSLRDASAVVGSATFAPAANSNTTANHEAATWEIATTSSNGGSSSAQPSCVPSPSLNRDTVDKPSPGPSLARKRKPEDSHVEKKPARCTKRTRTAEVHNLSERRRRDRINEKIRALQELIPRCNKSDKASVLDEAIEYVKSLQLQVQIMAMGCGMVPMVPMVFPGMQQFLPAMGIGSPVMPFPNVIPSPAATSASLNPRFAHPAFHYPPMAAQEAALNAHNLQSSNMAWMPSFADPFQQNNQTMLHADNGSKPGSSRAVDNRDKNHGAAL